jgi:cellulose synthase/poly-beta-1,6-N-acetylglucosamine synthase-like glycosyltransferase
MEAFFWTLLAIPVYVYVGYPLLLLFLRALTARRSTSPGAAAGEPTITLVISAFNEEEVIAEKLSNSFQVSYPREKLQILVVSDASDDRTDEIVASFRTQGVELLRMGSRSGKTLGLNEAVQAARGDIVVFSDANAMYAPDALRLLARGFDDAAVGAVVGESTYLPAVVESERNEGLYWRYETAIKQLESDVSSVVGGDGAIYAIRRSLYVPMAADALSDFLNPLQIVMAGHRCSYESSARSYERAADNFDKEFRRKVRIVNRAWRATMKAASLLNPLRHGLFAIQLISHKLLRWLVPFFMIGSFALNAVLAPRGGTYLLLFCLQVAFYLLALAGYAMRRRAALPSVFSVPYYFCLANLASLCGIIDAYRGKTYTTWSTPRTAATRESP